MHLHRSIKCTHTERSANRVEVCVSVCRRVVRIDTAKIDDYVKTKINFQCPLIN